LELIALLKTCWKRKWIILAFAVVLPLATIIVSLKTTKVYEAVAKVKIVDFEDTQALLQRQIPESWGRLDHVAGIPTVSQAEVIRSRMVVEPVIEKLGLRRRVTGIDKLLKSIGILDEYRDEYIRLEKLVEPGFIGAFLQRRQIFIEPMEDADIIEIYAYSDVLEEARDMANEVALSYVDQTGKLKKQKAREALEIIEYNLANAKRRLEKTQDDLRKFQASNYIVDLDKRIIDMQGNLNDFENRYFTLRNDLMVRESRLKELTEAEDDPEALHSTLKSVEAYDHIQDLETQLLTLESSLAAMLTEKTAKHPDAVDLRVRIEALRKQIINEVKRLIGSEIIDLTKSREMTAISIEDVKRELGRLASTSRRLKDLQRQVDMVEALYLNVAAEQDTALTAAATNYSNASIITRAALPDPSDPYYPEPVLYVILSTIVGMMFGFGMAFIVEFMDVSVKSAADIEQASSLTLLGAIPKTFLLGRAKIGKPDNAGKFAGAILEMKHNVLTHSKGKKVIAVASSLKKEGKSTLIGHLAAALAEEGHKVALVDLNLKRPALHQMFGLKSDKGVAGLLAGGSEDIMQTPKEFPGLDFFAAGPKGGDVVHKLGSSALADFLDRLEAEHDYVLLDAAAIDSYAGGSVIAAQARCAFLVASVEGPSAQEIEETVGALKNAGAEIIGVVANRV